MPVKSQKVMKPRRAHIFFGLLKNDLEFIDAQALRQKIYDQSRFSVLYFLLLIGSVLICTLGLLTNSTAIVIGGMLIAPLMWPLARLGYGIAHRSPRHLYRGALLVFASILIGVVSAYMITSISPIKVINDEILARTSPTLMDLFIALTAGFIAAIAITQKKIADSLAGVAIAVSLMPPLCTAGIALSLRDVELSLGALLLFAVNAACITLVTTLVLVYTDYVRTKKIRIATKAAIFNVVFILLLAIPLVQFLRIYSFEVEAYSSVTTEMQEFISQKNAGATFENIKITRADGSTMSISADLLIPNDSVFTYQDNELLISKLESAVDKNILLNLRIQTIIEPISKDQSDNEIMIKVITDKLVEELNEVDDSFKISSINIARTVEGAGWTINAEILSDPELVPTTKALTEIDNHITATTNEDIELNLTFLPRLTLRSSDQTLSQEARKIVERNTTLVNADAEVSLFGLTTKNNNTSVTYTVTGTDVGVFTEDYLIGVKVNLQSVIGTEVSLQVRLVQATDLRL